MIPVENVLICLGIPLLLSLGFVRKDIRRFTGAMLAGMLISLLSAYISGFLAAAGNVDVENTAVFLSPIVEEIMKYLPLLLYLLIFKPKNENLLLGSVGIGIGFSTFENCCYFLSPGELGLAYVLIRGLAVGVMHLISAILLAMGLCLVRRIGILSVSGIAGVLSISVTLHAIYNLLVSEPGVPSAIAYMLPMAAALVTSILYKKVWHNRAFG